MQIEIVYPEHIENIREIKEILLIGDVVGGDLELSCDELRDNLNVTTSKESGIARRESILGIIPFDTDSIEDRRKRVHLKWYEQLPYTMIMLKKRLDASIGKDKYKLSMDYKNRALKLYVEIERKSIFDSVSDLINDMVPLDILIDLSLLYTQYVEYGAYTHTQMRNYTHEQLRNGVKNYANKNRKL